MASLAIRAKDIAADLDGGHIQKRRRVSGKACHPMTSALPVRVTLIDVGQHVIVGHLTSNNTWLTHSQGNVNFLKTTGYTD